MMNKTWGKDIRVLFRLNYSFINQPALVVIQVLKAGTIFNLVKLQFIECVQPLSLFQTASRWLDSLAYIENITAAYSQY